MTPTMKRQSAYIRELFAITEAIAKFRHYLLGRKFIIRTDQQSLEMLLDQRLTTPDQQKWLHKFLGFDFEVHYKPGKENIVADSLSRCFFAAWSSPRLDWLETLKSELTKDEKLNLILQQCIDNTQVDTSYSQNKGLFLWKNRLVIPATSSLIAEICRQYHDSLKGGHSGIAKTIERICLRFYWPNMQRQIREYVLSCALCKQAKVDTRLPAGLLHPLPIPGQVWESICMDFITALPMVQGKSVIMVVSDRLSKFAHFIPLKHDFTSQFVADAFILNVVKLHGFPCSIISDRDKVFVSKFWRQLFKSQGTNLEMSSSYQPERDGQSENLNKTLEMYLRCFCFDNPKGWLCLLPWAQFWYNTSFHRSIHMTPYKALYGRDPHSLVKYEFSQTDEKTLQELLIERDLLLDKLKESLVKSQEYMKKYADRQRRHEEFVEGELVLVKLQPYCQHSLALRKHQKLGLRYFGPFKISRKISAVAYKLDLPPEARIHNVFHISLLKKFRGSHTPHYLPLSLQTTKQGPLLTPSAVLAERTLIVNGQEVKQLQVQWGIGSGAFVSWEDVEELSKTYPNLNLEDKVGFKGKGNVRNKKDADLDADLEGNTVEVMQDNATTESVSSSGHITTNSQDEGPRRSNRKRITNRLWQDFVI